MINLSELDNEQSTITMHNPLLRIERQTHPIDFQAENIAEDLLYDLDHYKGALFSSNFEYTGRYTRWDVGFIKPPLEVKSQGSHFFIEALNKRGQLLLPLIYEHLKNASFLETVSHNDDHTIIGKLPKSQQVKDEEARTKQTTIFDVLRRLQSLFYNSEDSFLGLYGAFGFDLIFQFEHIEKQKPRTSEQNDIHLFLPDELYIVDRKKGIAYQIRYEFSYDGLTTKGLPREGSYTEYKHNPDQALLNANKPRGYYADLVKKAKPYFYRGDLFEVVPTRVLYKASPLAPSEVFNQLKELNPSPYGFLIHLGSDFLVGSSPEMYVRVEGNRVETCPISGTIKRGENAIEDAENIKALLNSMKEEAELTMCTDVDRNDKSRVCIPGSVKVIGRRQIEAYSHLFHTVDHIEGELRPEFDAFDAFMTHMWAVTVTGAPKLDAIRWIEKYEESPRGWYGGAIGWFTFDGGLNTGLTLRTARLNSGLAEIRVGATLLHASEPESEELETDVKVAALEKALEPKKVIENIKERQPAQVGKGKNILLVDHEDSFVHTLANYFKQTGAKVTTCRADVARELIRQKQESVIDLVVLSPGPGRPERFDINTTIDLCLQKEIPIFGVCLGLQGIAEYFGGELKTLATPCHGMLSDITLLNKEPLFKEMEGMKVGRYHSLYVDALPKALVRMAETHDHILMAAKHQKLPIYGVQFHPESILSTFENSGLQLINNLMDALKRDDKVYLA
ncbi:anthranilate synthase [Pullulanibacillus pueri]|uniref:Anthranilate synthase n=1 Tax=Pullulanibacillus pueri TaxID=1437324 RepID=A0A8J2ZT54_9BACL|nr:anthranilate synthase component I [Pullulanibacillus pueri]MBM7681057.1 anthranilate synthase [Pullulanibacillus pueri]GGH76873.1 anthranilate synthase component I [Pullulanibacillus pueri]